MQGQGVGFRVQDDQSLGFVAVCGELCKASKEMLA